MLVVLPNSVQSTFGQNHLSKKSFLRNICIISNKVDLVLKSDLYKLEYHRSTCCFCSSHAPKISLTIYKFLGLFCCSTKCFSGTNVMLAKSRWDFLQKIQHCISLSCFLWVFFCGEENEM